MPAWPVLLHLPVLLDLSDFLDFLDLLLKRFFVRPKKRRIRLTTPAPRAGVLRWAASTSSSPYSSLSSIDVVSEESDEGSDDDGGRTDLSVSDDGEFVSVSGSSRPPASTSSGCGMSPRLLFCNY